MASSGPSVDQFGLGPRGEMVRWADVLLALEELRVKTLQDVAEAELEMTPLCKDLGSPKPIPSPERDELFLSASSSRCCFGATVFTVLLFHH